MNELFSESFTEGGGGVTSKKIVHIIELAYREGGPRPIFSNFIV